ncbi:10233_t:CDS:2 [Acaulospora morrowiae]|uniref:10233_t:CDS:1 n=1 Tax=Acaulospora morrowiae TaxID=94023 RepID=A0A9N9F7K6_9GLOM|nr:10233_t:CDS:2 [Acaulospora morrowiae]
MPKVKPKLKNLLSKLQQEKKIRDKASQPYPKKRPSSHVRPPRPPPYQPGDSILLIGEGNFSFARALAENVLHVGHLIIATTLDSEEIMSKKYDDARDHISAFLKCGGKVLYEVDGTQLSKCKGLKNKKFDKIVFNFPHAGAGIKDQDRNILANQKLIESFLNSAIPFLKSRALYSDSNDGEILITIKTGLPYDNWNIKKIIKSTGALAVRETLPFNVSQYPGYEHRRTLGFKGH